LFADRHIGPSVLLSLHNRALVEVISRAKSSAAPYGSLALC
jgi:hypothetical protein